MLNEARIYESILPSLHSNLVIYLGCVVEEGWVVRLALRRYIKSLDDYCQSEMLDQSTIQWLMDCLDQIEAASEHLHSLGFAHNDISPSNIMFDKTGKSMLIDLDSCAPLGSTLTKGGLVTGWKGPTLVKDVTSINLQLNVISWLFRKSGITYLRNWGGGWRRYQRTARKCGYMNILESSSSSRSNYFGCLSVSTALKRRCDVS